MLGDGQITGTLWEDPYTGGGAYIGGRADNRNTLGRPIYWGSCLHWGTGR